MRSVMFGVENSLISTVGLVAAISVGVKDNHIVILGAVAAITIEAVAMGVGEYLSDDAVQELDKLKRHRDDPLLSGLLMMAAGTLAGLIPLAPIVIFDYPKSLYVAIFLALTTLFLLGFFKGKLVGSRPYRSGLKILVVGGLATLLGLAVGLIFKL